MWMWNRAGSIDKKQKKEKEKRLSGSGRGCWFWLNFSVCVCVCVRERERERDRFGSYLRALRICYPQHLYEEFKYIKHSLKSLKYPRFFILNARKKALPIHSSNKLKKNTPSILITHRPIFQPTNAHNKPLYHKLTKLGIPIIQTTLQTIKSPTNISKLTNNTATSHASIYSIPYKDSDKHYIGETQRNLEKRIYEHKRSIKLNDNQNALLPYMLDHKIHFQFFPSYFN